jgi:HTH-type transcriptional regulator, sugar sensing transcriptional regulator
MLSTLDKYYINMNIKSILQNIDLTDFEATTFTALLAETKGSSVLNLSKKLNLPRATIYGHLDSLIQKGLVKKTLGDQGTLFFAEDLETILSIYNEKISQIKKAKTDLAQIIKTQQFPASHQPKFIFYDKPQSARTILRDILRSREKQSYWVWPVKEMIKSVAPENLRWFNEERIKHDMWLNVLWPPKRKIQIKNHPFLLAADPKKSLRRIKLLPENIDQTLGYGIYGTKVAFISSTRENYGFIIDSQELAQTLKSQFDYFWKISKEHKE